MMMLTVRVENIGGRKKWLNTFYVCIMILVYGGGGDGGGVDYGALRSRREERKQLRGKIK